jgi:hypothetical protein
MWNGNGGKTYFYQCEMPYDPPSQAEWQHGGVNGYAGYKVADAVTMHEAWGMGVYCAFRNNVRSANAYEAPAGAVFHHIRTRFLSGGGGIDNVLNGTGGAVQTGAPDKMLF